MGKAAVYLANTLWKLRASSKLTEDKEFGIKGFLINADLVKSRSSAAGVSCVMVYDQVNGFDNVLTNYVFMKEAGLIGGAGQGFFIKGLDNVKFTQKNFKNKYLEMDGLRRHFDELLEETLINSIPRPEINGSLDVDQALRDEFEQLKIKLKLQECELEGMPGTFWWDSKSDAYFDNDGVALDFE